MMEKCPNQCFFFGLNLYKIGNEIGLKIFFNKRKYFFEPLFRKFSVCPFLCVIFANKKMLK